MQSIEPVRQRLLAHPALSIFAVLLIALLSIPIAIVLTLAAAAVLLAPALIRKHAPEVAIENAVKTRQGETLRVVQTVSAVMADEILLKREAERHAFQVRTWEARMTKAYLAGAEDEARRCIERKQHHEAELARVKAELERQGETVQKLRPHVDAMRRETAAAESQASTLAVRRRRADARRTVVMTASGLSTRAGRETFERVTEDVVRAEAEAEALESLLGTDGADEHAEGWEKRERAEKVETELEELRARHRRGLPGKVG